MKDCDIERQLESEATLRKIVADFEQLERTIDSVLPVLKSGNGQDNDVQALQRAKEAARKGAALARSKLGLE